MIDWTAEGLAFLRDAAAYTGFYDVLAGRAALASAPGDLVCDAGCGPGLLAGALSRLGRRVVGVDVSAEALEAALDAAPAQVRLMRADVFALPADLRFDSMVFCFFGSVPQIVKAARAHCRGKVAMFRKNWRMRRFTTSPQPNHRIRLRQAEEELEALGIPHSSQVFDLEMGQPFRSFEEAMRFFRLYGKDPDPGVVRSRLDATDNEEFPLFLSERKSVGMVTFEARDARGFGDLDWE